jgi:hypothetical protein
MLYPGKGGWYFVRIPKEDSEDLVRGYAWPRGGFKSIPVEVTLGETTWKTSIFGEKKGTHLLAIKKEIRIKESVNDGDVVTLKIEVRN